MVVQEAFPGAVDSNIFKDQDTLLAETEKWFEAFSVYADDNVLSELVNFSKLDQRRMSNVTAKYLSSVVNAPEEWIKQQFGSERLLSLNCYLRSACAESDEPFAYNFFPYLVGLSAEQIRDIHKKDIPGCDGDVLLKEIEDAWEQAVDTPELLLPPALPEPVIEPIIFEIPRKSIRREVVRLTKMPKIIFEPLDTINPRDLRPSPLLNWAEYGTRDE